MVRAGRLLVAIASDDELRNATQLRKVTLVDDAVDLDVDDRWSALPRLVALVQAVPGVADVSVDGQRTAPTVTTSATG